MSGRDAFLWEIYNSQRLQTGSGLTTGMSPFRWNLEVLDSHLCFTALLRCLPKGVDLCPAGHFFAMSKGGWGPACAMCSWRSLSSPVSDDAPASCPWSPLLSSLRSHERLFYSLWPLSKSLSGLCQAQFCYWQRECKQETISCLRQVTLVPTGLGVFFWKLFLLLFWGAEGCCAEGLVGLDFPNQGLNLSPLKWAHRV